MHFTPKSKTEISVVIPVYGCKAALPELCSRLNAAITTITEDYEIILVEDHCPQNSWEAIVPLCKQDSRIKGIRLSRNFGQACAIAAGIDECIGNWVVVMDCDLQDPPEVIPLLYNKAKEGFDVVFARRNNRKDSKLTLFLSRAYYKTYSYFVDAKVDPQIGNFSIASRTVIDNFCKMREHSRAYQLFISWLGFNQTYIDIESQERHSGKSSYNLRKKLKFASVLILSHSNKPLILTIRLGLLVAFISLLIMLALIISKIAGYDYLTGWLSSMVSIYLVGGLLMSSIGISGLYIGNIYTESKNRPIYVVAEEINIEEKDEDHNA